MYDKDMKQKRLFLFAGFCPNGKIDDSLIYYTKSLSAFGDVILCMDSNLNDGEITKVQKYTIHTIATHHGEYDFGSYKRCFQYARDCDILKNYNVLYLVNDSVYGPTKPLKHTINNIEQISTDAAGLIVSKHKTHAFMESWFVRLNKSVFMTKWFNDFMQSITHLEHKYQITVQYEHGLSNLITNNNCTWDGIYHVRGRYTYNNPKKLFLRGCPFIKKASFTRHNGALGYQIKYVLSHCDNAASKIIKKSGNDAYSHEYMSWFLTSNPLTYFTRGIKYIVQKQRNKS